MTASQVPGESVSRSARNTSVLLSRTAILAAAAALIFLLVAALALTTPVTLDPATRIVGNLYTTTTDDLAVSLWLFWYVKSNLADIFTRPAEVRTTNLFFFPVGFDAYLHGGFISVLFALPYMLLTDNLTLVRNLYMWSIFAFNGFALYLLLRDMKAGFFPSLIAGAVFAFNSWTFGELAMGNLGHTIIGFFPLFLISVRSMLQRRSVRKQALAGGAWFALLFLPYVFFPFFAVLFGTPLVITELIKQKRAVRIRCVRNIMALFLVGMSLSMPLMYPHFSRLFSTGQVHGLTLGSLFTLKSEQKQTLGEDVFQHMGVGTEPSRETWQQPGMILLLVLLAAMPFLPGKKRRFWIIYTVFWYLLAMGPYLHLSPSIKVPLPYLLLYRVIPFFPRIIWPKRFMALFFISACVVIGLALDSLCVKLRTRGAGRRKTAVLMTGLLLVVIAASYPALCRRLPLMHTTDVPEFFRELGKKEEGAVIDLPSDIPATAAMGAWYQTIHGKPMLTGPGMNFPQQLPQQFRSMMQENSFLTFINMLPEKPLDPEIINPADLQWVKEAGFTHITLHLPFFAMKSHSLNTYYMRGNPKSMGVRGRGSLLRCTNTLTGLFGPPVFRDDLIVVFDITGEKKP